jgi:hypothetical protein
MLALVGKPLFDLVENLEEVQPTCYQSGPGTQCQTPGNVQFNDAPPPVSFYPYGGEAGLLGGGDGRG